VKGALDWGPLSFYTAPVRHLLLVLLVAACGRETKSCSRADQCVLANGGTGVCEQGFCAFLDPSCASGLRWAADAEQRDECVPGPDAGIDALEIDAIDDAAGSDAIDAVEPADGVTDAPAVDAAVDATPIDAPTG
jgi:hypothetical protein